MCVLGECSEERQHCVSQVRMYGPLFSNSEMLGFLNLPGLRSFLSKLVAMVSVRTEVPVQWFILLPGEQYLGRLSNFSFYLLLGIMNDLL